MTTESERIVARLRARATELARESRTWDDGTPEAYALARAASELLEQATAIAALPVEVPASVYCETCADEHETDYGRCVTMLGRAKALRPRGPGDRAMDLHTNDGRVWTFNQRGELVRVLPAEAGELRADFEEHAKWQAACAARQRRFVKADGESATIQADKHAYAAEMIRMVLAGATTTQLCRPPRPAPPVAAASGELESACAFLDERRESVSFDNSTMNTRGSWSSSVNLRVPERRANAFAATIVATARALGWTPPRPSPPVAAPTEDERIGNAPDADVGYKRDDQNAARERVAKWGRRDAADACRFVRGCGNDLAFYAFGDGHGAYVAITIDEENESTVMYANRETKETDVRSVSPQNLAALFAKLARVAAPDDRADAIETAAKALLRCSDVACKGCDEFGCRYCNLRKAIALTKEDRENGALTDLEYVSLHSVAAPDDAVLRADVIELGRMMDEMMLRNWTEADWPTLRDAIRALVERAKAGA